MAFRFRYEENDRRKNKVESKTSEIIVQTSSLYKRKQRLRQVFNGKTTFNRKTTFGKSSAQCCLQTVCTTHCV